MSGNKKWSKDYYCRMKKKGYVKTSVWIKPEQRRVLRDFVNQLNKQPNRSRSRSARTTTGG